MRTASRRPVPVLAFVAATAVPATLLLGISTGVFPGQSSVPINAATGFPSCGFCHAGLTNARPEQGKVAISIAAPRTFQKGATVAVSVTTTGGLRTPRAGFLLETDRGTFQDGTNAQAGNNGKIATHRDSFSRTWSFKFVSSQTGLVKWHGVSNTVNGNGRADPLDTWGFFGPDSDFPGTPFRVFVNDDKIFEFGSACDGSQELPPVVGMPKNAAVGTAFPMEVHNIPPNTVVLGALGVSNTMFGAIPLPLSLTALGAPGCALRVSLDFTAAAVSTGSGAGNGVATVNWGLPNMAALRGVDIYFQALVFDKGANSFGMATTHGLRATIQ